MTTFQKLIIIILVMFVGISGFYLFRQEQIKKGELELEKSQKQISDCKYILNNKEVILKDDYNLLKYIELQDGQNSIGYKNANKIYNSHYAEWMISADNCRDLLRKLNY